MLEWEIRSIYACVGGDRSTVKLLIQGGVFFGCVIRRLWVQIPPIILPPEYLGGTSSQFWSASDKAFAKRIKEMSGANNSVGWWCGTLSRVTVLPVAEWLRKTDRLATHLLMKIKTINSSPCPPCWLVLLCVVLGIRDCYVLHTTSSQISCALCAWQTVRGLFLYLQHPRFLLLCSFKQVTMQQ